MSSGEPSDPEINYFRDLERAFVERRGDPLFISNADWVFLAKLWKKRVPMRVVLRGITDAFDAHAHSFARKQKVRSLKFCETEITAAVDRYRRALRSEGPGPRGLGAALHGLAERITGGAGSPEVEDARQIAARGVLEVAKAVADDKTFDVALGLARIEDGLVEAASRALGPEVVAGFSRDSRGATTAYRSRMPAKVYETLIEESVRRKILQRFGLPRLLLSEIE